MSTPTIEDLKSFLPDVPNDSLEDLEKLLDLIDCPPDFRGLQKVLAVLEYLFSTVPDHLIKVIEMESSKVKKLLTLFSNVDESHYARYSNQIHAKGWMSRRPIYSLLFIYYDHQTPQAASALVFFLQHYYQYESQIVESNRVETSIRAFRLLYTDLLIDRVCFETTSVEHTANNIRDCREALRVEEEIDDDSHLSSRIGYLRDLEHFYRLDWKKRINVTRSTKKSIRASYSRKTIERVIGSNNLFTASLNKRPLKKSLIESGITASEDYPELVIVNTEQPTQSKPKHELPDISTIKDIAKIRSKNRTVSKDVRRSHNLITTSRNILQPHELYYLWQALNSRSNNRINHISKSHIQLILHIILLTGRSLESVCQLPLNKKGDRNQLGFTLTKSQLLLTVAPKPTADRGKHSDNTNLLKTKTLASLVFPNYLLELLSHPDIDIKAKISGNYTVNAFRKGIESFLKTLNERYKCQISLQRIENYLVNRTSALEQDDPVILEILRGELSYYSRSPRHYAWYSEEEINNRVQELWSETFKQIRIYKPEFCSPIMNSENLEFDHIGLGSQFTPTKEAISDWVMRHTTKLNQFTAFNVVKNLKNLVEYHNEYTVYTLIMLINASGYRAVYNPMPSFDLLLSRYHGLCISDKDSAKTFSHTRVIACPEILETQLQLYKQHAHTLANLISHLYPIQSQQLFAQTCDYQLIELSSKVERTEWFLSVKNSRSNDGVFFLFIGDDDDDTFYRTRNSGPSTLSEYITLPLNFGRHYVRRYLQKANVHQELIKFQLGHWVTGETPLEKYSSLLHQEAIKKLRPILNQMLAELGWNSLPSLLTRKRA